MFWVLFSDSKASYLSNLCYSISGLDILKSTVAGPTFVSGSVSFYLSLPISASVLFVSVFFSLSSPLSQPLSHICICLCFFLHVLFLFLRLCPTFVSVSVSFYLSLPLCLCLCPSSVAFSVSFSQALKRQCHDIFGIFFINPTHLGH